MTIYNILDLLARYGRIEGPDRSGNYKCHCPAHNDKNSSLSVKDGEQGIVFKCHANCTTDSICTALGIELKELMHEDAPKAPKQESGLKPWERIEKKYAYTDENGNILYWNCRLHSPKDFRQTRPNPQNPERMLWSMDKNARKVLYRLPEIIAAKQRRESIFIVEGEKDADTLHRLGYCGTTATAGGGQAWDEEYCRELEGAERVLILGDNDKTGYKHQLTVQDAMREHGIIAELVLLKRVWPEIPKKGDITDLIEHFGDTEGERLLRKAAELGATRAMIEKELSGMEPVPVIDIDEQLKQVAESKPVPQVQVDDTEVARAYMNVEGYFVGNGCLHGVNADGSVKQLTTFAALPRKMVTRDDGENVTTLYEIEGWNRDGRPLGLATVKASEFSGMGWVNENWGFEANMLPGNTIKDRVRYAMTEAGRTSAKKETLYIHTGWRQIGGKLCYLHGTGAIGSENVSVALEGKLGAYDMGIAKDISLFDACAQSLNLFGVMDEHIAYPVMAMAYLAPLVSFMEVKGIAPRFGLWLLGATQSGKTTAAMLTLSHFGNFNSQDKIPASFTDTANSVQRSAYLLKDMPILIDDYFPVSNAQERRKMEAMAQSLSRSVGNGASRGRLNSEMQQRTGYKPRGVTLFTGEDTPDIKESGLARFFIVNVKRGDVRMGDDLTELQEAAADGVLVRAMTGYIEWLARKAESLPDELYETYKQYRSVCREQMGAAGARACEALASMLTATGMMLKYWQSTGIIDEEARKEMLKQAVSVNCETVRTQARELRSQKPTAQFMEIIRELLNSGVNKCLDKTDTGLSINVIGWQDETFYYFMPELTYKAVSKFCADQGTAFPVTLSMLKKSLVEEKILTEEYLNKLKKIRGRTARYLWIPRELIDGRESDKDEQTEMRETDEATPF